MFARLTRAERIGSGPTARTAFEFDTVEEGEPGEVAGWIAGKEDALARFGLLRLVTTERHFSEVALGDPVVGRWYALSVSSDGGPSTLRAWFARLTGEGYTDLSVGRLTGGEVLDPPEGDGGPPRPRSLGAAAAPRRRLPSAVWNACSPLRALPRDPAAVDRVLAHTRICQIRRVQVRDVGQASFVSLQDDRGISLMHFDVGSPVAFNLHTFPAKPREIRSGSETPVVLSHWDWDHLHAALQQPRLCSGPWVVPDQDLGPGAARLATQLANGGRLHVWPGGVRRFPWGVLGQCMGANSMNDTGLSALVTIRRGLNVLLTGDAAYRTIPPAMLQSVHQLVATHHGGRLLPGDLPPRASGGRSRWVISCGRANTYGHPHPEALASHASVGWGRPEFTRCWGSTPRNDRWL